MNPTLKGYQCVHNIVLCNAKSPAIGSIYEYLENKAFKAWMDGKHGLQDYRLQLYVILYDENEPVSETMSET